MNGSKMYEIIIVGAGLDGYQYGRAQAMHLFRFDKDIWRDVQASQ
jgi:hypothetical protein